MAEKIITNEFVYFTGSEEKIRDFSGEENSFSEEQRFCFLNKLQKAQREWYDDENLDKKAFSEDEVKAFLDGVEHSTPKIRRVINFDKMTAYTLLKKQQYKNLYLYCGASLENDELVLSDKDVRPNPCAKYELNNSVLNISVSFDVFIGKEYKCSQDKKCGQGQAGRVIEIRTKTLDVVKIKMFNTGEVYSMSQNMWEPKSQLLGKIKFGEYNHFEICVKEDVEITLNGEKTEGIMRTAEGEIDNIFFDGGMHPRGTWRIKNFAINGEKASFCENPFEENALLRGTEVELPYAIGGYENRDKNLYLVSKFSVSNWENAILDVETLDPCGKVWINDVLVIDTDTFMRNEVSVTDVLKKGENEIKILVEPRAPEVYYYWHRHTDCYNGWFCGRVSLLLTEKTFIKRLDVKTKKVAEITEASACVTLNKTHTGEIEIFASECYPDKTAEQSVVRKRICGDGLRLDFDGVFKAWSHETPVLYAIRAVLYDENGKILDDFVVETGFRTIEQKDGAVILNNKRVLLNGALLMQFLPPYNEVPINHNCPTTEQLAYQAMMLKNMNGNTMRIHTLGYGTNDRRLAEICDRLGIMLIWLTRFIDSLESLVWEGKWLEKEYFKKQMKSVLNHPSIIMWEGSNEYHPKDLAVIDRMYDEFTDAVKSIDDTRLICPCSHLYYGGGLYDIGCKYYNDDGTQDESGNKFESGKGWKDDKVVRSVHTYSLLCGYGMPWEDMRKQNWKWQKELLESKKHSYLVTEYAITALANPNTKEAMENPYVESYERPDEERALGRIFEQSEWKESQAYQALCAFNAVKKMRILGVDGMIWCCLSSGANDGSYLKPPIDFYGYKKLGFYALSDAYKKIYACKNDTDVSYGTGDKICPIILNTSHEGKFNLEIKISDEDGNIVALKCYNDINIDEKDSVLNLEAFKPEWKKAGYYTIKYVLTEHLKEKRYGK